MPTLQCGRIIFCYELAAMGQYFNEMTGSQRKGPGIPGPFQLTLVIVKVEDWA